MEEDETSAGARFLSLEVAGPVGTGKSSVIAALCRQLRNGFALGVVTNDIYTDENALFLRSEGVLPEECIRTIETGACPHTAIRGDVTVNRMAIGTWSAPSLPSASCWWRAAATTSTRPPCPPWRARRSSCSTSPVAATWRARAGRGSAVRISWSST